MHTLVHLVTTTARYVNKRIAVEQQTPVTNDTAITTRQ
jgi:hypothetical protein